MEHPSISVGDRKLLPVNGHIDAAAGTESEGDTGTNSADEEARQSRCDRPSKVLHQPVWLDSLHLCFRVCRDHPERLAASSVSADDAGRCVLEDKALRGFRVAELGSESVRVGPGRRCISVCGA